jgi:lysozyme family protein
MRENFEYCLATILENEGGFVNHPKDPGGATNWGITIAVLSAKRGHQVSVDDVKRMPRSEAAEIYRRQYWDPIQGDQLPSGVDLAVFDFAVNSGVSRAAKTLQRVIGTRIDGHIGAMTIDETRRRMAVSTIHDFCDQREAFVKSLNTFGTFGKGWMKRIKKIRERSQALAARRVAVVDIPIEQTSDQEGSGKALDENKKLISTTQGKGNIISALGLSGSAITEAANTLSPLGDTSNYLRLMFGLLLAVGVGLSTYAAIKSASSAGQD